MSALLNPTSWGIEAVHARHVAGRRARVLSEHLAQLIPQNSRLLDIGSGDGEIAWLVNQVRPDLEVSGVDVLVRPDTRIPVSQYDGDSLPFENDHFDVVMLVDVLHHCEQPKEVLREAVRVSRHAVVIKDHVLEGFASRLTLRAMDWVGNHRHGVALPYNYWRWSQWQAAFDELGLTLEQRVDRLNLYPWPASLLFDRALHFASRLSLIPSDCTQYSEDQRGIQYAHA